MLFPVENRDETDFVTILQLDRK